ncbi:ankyrin repeat-containing domain, PGG domain protein [Artemisia annua]|uniref:Ankyrin repeat-containing domain, PGG domain protein n=1 Tax=Artemisia annua TaxID=35608 RepID=A0A2U1LGR6_ARTAN|nr:ankyrin repeat-containing domain, PGG domain protein [Artemisia annua]
MERDLRKGEPLSLFLFILVVEALQMAILESCNKGIFKEIPSQMEVQSASTGEQNPLSQHHQEINMSSTSYADYPRINVPCEDLIRGPKQDYFKIGVPLYEASIKCDWEAAKYILDKYKEIELVKYSITENGETVLHIAASAKVPEKVDDFVRNLVKKMKKEDLELVDKNQNTALYLAATAGNIEIVKILMANNPILDTIPGGGGHMMPLYAAVLFGNKDVARYLYECSNGLAGDGWNPHNRGWLLEKCVEIDMFDVAQEVVKKYPELGRSGILLGFLARKPHAFSKALAKSGIRANSSVGSKVRTPEKESEALPLLRILWEDILTLPKRKIDSILRGPPDTIRSADGWVFQAMQLKELISEQLEELENTYPNEHRAPQLIKLVSRYVLKMHGETRNIMNEESKKRTSKGDQALELEKIISENTAKLHEDIHKFKQRAEEKFLHGLISNHITFMRQATSLKETYSSRVMFIAAEVGNTNFLLELIRRSPDLIWKVNDNNQTIFHVAVKHRHAVIYNLLYGIGSMKDMVTPLRDSDGNSMLHLAAMSTMKKNLEDVSGAALQMQRELLWFKEVERMVPPSYRERLNNDGLTPRELFTKEHQDLITQGENWMKATASQCMVVATLIATIVFAAAFTVPGGYNQNDGIPMFKQNLSFVSFVVADAISLFLSSASILTFLSILTSRYAERDFVKSLPMKLTFGLATLFLSIGTMMITFSVSFFVLYHKEMKWIPIFISLFAVTPAILYVALQYHLLIDVFRSTYGASYLFKPANQVLFYENPKY